MKRLVFIALLAVALAVTAACDNDETPTPAAEPSPSPTATTTSTTTPTAAPTGTPTATPTLTPSVSPTETPVQSPTPTDTPTPEPGDAYPAGTRVDIPVIDTILDAMETGYVDAVASLVEFAEAPCIAEEGAEAHAGPLCRTGEAVGTVVEYVVASTCAPFAYYRRDEEPAIRDLLQPFTEPTTRLYAAYAMPADGDQPAWNPGRWGLIFAGSSNIAIRLYVGDVGIMHANKGCGETPADVYSRDALAPGASVILPPPGEATPTPTASASPTATPSPTETATPDPSGTPKPVTGLFTEPMLRDPDSQATLGPRVDTFEPWNGESTMLYDVETGTATDLGPGWLGRFSPDGTKMAWVAIGAASQTANVIDIATGDTKALGPARTVGWLDDSTLFTFLPDGNDLVKIDIATGDRQPITRADLPPDYVDHPSGDGYRILVQYIEDYHARFTVVAPDGMKVLRFDAYRAVHAGPGELAVATIPEDGTTNIFLVDIATGEATFVATSTWREYNWPLAANADYVTWTEDYCGGGKTRILARATDELVELDQGLWLEAFSPGGLLAVGAFGANALIDPATYEYTTVLPGREPGGEAYGDKAWSPDYRYTSQGQYGGHGGLCG